MMNIFFHLSTLLIFAFNFSGFTSSVIPSNEVKTETSPSRLIEENEEFVPWTFTRKLTWNDFQCEPKRNSDAIASASTSLGVTYQLKNGELSYQISCNFSKVKSWGLVKTPYILAHEQAHFDITEIYARKLHATLLAYELDKRSYKQDINKIYNQIVAEKESFQKSYDHQTDHSRNKKLQYEWLDKIDQILLETESYATYP